MDKTTHTETASLASSGLTYVLITGSLEEAELVLCCGLSDDPTEEMPSPWDL